MEEYLDSDKGAAPENIPMMYVLSPLLRIPPHALVSQVQFHTLPYIQTISLNQG